MGNKESTRKKWETTLTRYFSLGSLYGCMKRCGVMKGVYFLFVCLVSRLGLLSCRHGMHWYEWQEAIERENKKRSKLSKGAWVTDDTRGREHDPTQAIVLWWLNGLRNRKKNITNGNSNHDNAKAIRTVAAISANTRKEREREKEVEGRGTVLELGSVRNIFFSFLARSLPFYLFRFSAFIFLSSPFLSFLSFFITTLIPFLGATIFHIPRSTLAHPFISHLQPAHLL